MAILELRDGKTLMLITKSTWFSIIISKESMPLLQLIHLIPFLQKLQQQDYHSIEGQIDNWEKSVVYMKERETSNDCNQTSVTVAWVERSQACKNAFPYDLAACGLRWSSRRSMKDLCSRSQRDAFRERNRARNLIPWSHDVKQGEQKHISITSSTFCVNWDDSTAPSKSKALKQPLSPYAPLRIPFCK